MLLSPRAPLAVGSAAIFALMWALFSGTPMPADLSRPHARLGKSVAIESCQTCHQEGGLQAGCLSCHHEIESQLDAEKGYHHFLMADGERRCADCHQEHFGHGFEPVNETSWSEEEASNFSHPHVSYDLHGAHDALTCSECHVNHMDAPFALANYPRQIRPRSFLGLTQDCDACHDDPHAGGLARCDLCHEQEAFHQPAFDHAQHFPFEGGHADLACAQCHEIPAPDTPRREPPFPFEEVRGEDCQECHDTPHRVEFAEACDTCHRVDDPHWQGARGMMTADLHTRTGFPLQAPHDQVACSRCHQDSLPFAERHPVVGLQGALRRPENCQACHQDVHAGQFDERYRSCTECHDRHAFTPHRFDAEEHARLFPLTGAHDGMACHSCHALDPDGEVRRFAGTPQRCFQCHQDPHAGQFDEDVLRGDCIECHRRESDSFRIEPFDHLEKTGFLLRGAHARADCEQCHTQEVFQYRGEEQIAQRFRSTAKECSACHGDVHGGQFEGRYSNCLECHDANFFRPTTFGHGDHGRRFPLTGAHEAVACTSCHRSNAAGVRVFSGTASSCKQCHGDPHAGQFSEQLAQNDCTVCHTKGAVSFEIRPFDHARETGYQLEGAHQMASCNGCHRKVDLQVGSQTLRVRRYRGTPKDCASCHEDIHQGQFEAYESCQSCHISLTRWDRIQFDHDTQSNFPLDGAHESVACARCHRPVVLADGIEVVQYRPLGQECRDCHEIEPGKSYRR